MSAEAIRRAIALLRAGRPIRISGAEGLTVASVETMTPELLDARDPQRGAALLISGHRAAALKLANERDAADPHAPVVIERAPWLDTTGAAALIDPGRDLDRGPTGPLHAINSGCGEAAAAALALARNAGLLPALWLLEPQETDAAVSIDDVRREQTQPSLEIVARAKLPLDGLPPTKIVAFQ